MGVARESAWSPSAVFRPGRCRNTALGRAEAPSPPAVGAANSGNRRPHDERLKAWFGAGPQYALLSPGGRCRAPAAAHRPQICQALCVKAPFLSCEPAVSDAAQPRLAVPWSPAQADTLNRFQTYGGMRPLRPGPAGTASSATRASWRRGSSPRPRRLPPRPHGRTNRLDAPAAITALTGLTGRSSDHPHLVQGDRLDPTPLSQQTLSTTALRGNSGVAAAPARAGRTVWTDSVRCKSGPRAGRAVCRGRRGAGLPVCRDDLSGRCARCAGHRVLQVPDGCGIAAR